MHPNGTRRDPIREEYFLSVEAFESASNYLFWIIAALSCAIFFIDRPENPFAHQITQWTFSALTIGMFVIGIAQRLYLIPRAEDARRRDFISSAFEVSLSYKSTAGYYNNSLTDPNQRIAAQILENSFFSKTIILHMLRRERMTTACYAAMWLLAVLNRDTDIGLLAIVSQVIFSEQIISNWLRLESARMRYEKTYEDTYRLLQTKDFSGVFTARVIEILGFYEASKINSGIVLSSAIFEKLNHQLSVEWEEIKSRLGI